MTAHYRWLPVRAPFGVARIPQGDVTMPHQPWAEPAGIRAADWHEACKSIGLHPAGESPRNGLYDNRKVQVSGGSPVFTQITLEIQMTAPSAVAPEKVPNPKAYVAELLPELPMGQTWDEVEIGGIDFAIAVPDSLDGMHFQVHGNEAKACQLYSRALRIDAPAKLDARERIKTARKNGTLDKVVDKLQEELVAFDVTSIATRAPRTPPTVTVPEQATYTKAEFEAAMAQVKGKIVFVQK